MILTIALLAAEAATPKPEPTVKERLQDIVIAEQKMEIAKANWSTGQRLQVQANKDFADAKAAAEAGKLSACIAAGGAKTEDCDFDYEKFTITKKPEPAKPVVAEK